MASWREEYPDVQAGWEVAHAHPDRALAEASARAGLVVPGSRVVAGPAPVPSLMLC